MSIFQSNTQARGTVWSGSVDARVTFVPLPKKRAVRLYHAARRFERQTRQPGHQDGALGRNGLKVLETLIFDFLNFTTGELWPSIGSIARRAGISERSVRRGLDNLKAAGVLNWQRRKDRAIAFGQMLWFQLSNADPLVAGLDFENADKAIKGLANRYKVSPHAMSIRIGNLSARSAR